jgi:hypothetical protein
MRQKAEPHSGCMSGAARTCRPKGVEHGRTTNNARADNPETGRAAGTNHEPDAENNGLKAENADIQTRHHFVAVKRGCLSG